MPSAKPLLLIVDDDSLISESLSFAFAKEYDVITSHSRAHALSVLRQLRQLPPLALVDLGLPPLPHRPDEGFALIGDLLALSPDMKIIVLSGQSDESNARHARTLGAVDFVAKPCDPSRLTELFRQALRFDNTPLATQAGGLIGESLPMQRLRLQLGQYANLAYPVLIEGESGSGKDIVASHYLHRLTHGNMVANVLQMAAWMARDLVEGKEVFVCPLPLYHVYALTSNLVQLLLIVPI